MNDDRNAASSTPEDDEGHFPLRGRIFAGLAFGLLLVGGAGGWAATAPLTGAVVAKGMVKVDRNLKLVQHRDGGIIGAINVREGDRVAQGDVLIRLDDAQTRAELSILEGQLAELTVKRARLVAERDEQQEMLAPPLPEDASDHLKRFLDGELKLFAGNMRNRVTQKEQLELTIRQLDDEIGGLTAQHEAKLKEVNLAETEHGKVKALEDKGLVTSPRVYNADRDLARLYGEQGAAAAGIARAKSRISEIRLRILAIDEEARTKTQSELSQVEPKIAELNERRVAIQDRLSRTEIRAPISGTVNELFVHTIGGVITPAETLITVVPQDATLKIEAQIPPPSIDQVHTGAPAKLRFANFNQRITPELHGAVSYVSPATSVDQTTKETYYLADVGVSPDEFAKLGGATLKPGMPVDVFVVTSERTALSYFIKPFTDQFSRAFTER